MVAPPKVTLSRSSSSSSSSCGYWLDFLFCFCFKLDLIIVHFFRSTIKILFTHCVTTHQDKTLGQISLYYSYSVCWYKFSLAGQKGRSQTRSDAHLHSSHWLEWPITPRSLTFLLAGTFAQKIFYYKRNCLTGKYVNDLSARLYISTWLYTLHAHRYFIWSGDKLNTPLTCCYP